jgi:glycosyltransferase involved in cell wall biosynthesis
MVGNRMSGLEGIVEVVPGWPPEVFIQRHIQALQDAGQSVRVVTRCADTKRSSEASVERGAQIDDLTRIPNFDRMSPARKLALAARYAFVPRPKGYSVRRRVLFGILSRLGPRLVHFHSVQLASPDWVAVCREMGVPYTVSVRGADVQEIPLRAKKWYARTRTALEGAAGIHTVCEALGHLPLLEGLRSCTIYTTVPVEGALEEYPSERAGCYHLVAVGRLHWRKCYRDLLVAVRGLLDSGIHVRLTIAGSGPDRERIQYWMQRLNVAEHVRLPGKVSSSEVRELFRSAHGYVQSSCAEGLSNALAEAMGCGCPVFATDVAGTHEIIHEGENGFLLRPLVPEGWIEKLSVVTDTGQMRHMRTAAWEEAGRRFDSRVHARCFREFYDNAEKNHSASEVSVAPAQSVVEPSGADEGAPGPQVNIELPWEWRFGVDLLLRCLAPLVQAGKLRLRIFGKGSAEDELRYLAELLKFDRGCLSDSESYREQCPRNSDSALFIRCRDVRRPEWIVASSQREDRVEIGDTLELVRCVQNDLRL